MKKISEMYDDIYAPNGGEMEYSRCYRTSNPVWMESCDIANSAVRYGGMEEKEEIMDEFCESLKDNFIFCALKYIEEENICNNNGEISDELAELVVRWAGEMTEESTCDYVTERIRKYCETENDD